MMVSNTFRPLYCSLTFFIILQNETHSVNFNKHIIKGGNMGGIFCKIYWVADVGKCFDKGNCSKEFYENTENYLWGKDHF